MPVSLGPPPLIVGGYLVYRGHEGWLALAPRSGEVCPLGRAGGGDVAAVAAGQKLVLWGRVADGNHRCPPGAPCLVWTEELLRVTDGGGELLTLRQPPAPAIP